MVIDGGSTDDTVNLAREWDVRVIHNERRDAESAKSLGFAHARGSYFMYLDADIELARPYWWKKILKPYEEDSYIVGAFTRFMPHRDQSWVDRCLSYQELHLDPMLEFLTPRITAFRVESTSGYEVISLHGEIIPPIGICLYKKAVLDEVLQRTEAPWVDVAIPILLAKHGFNRFAYVPQAGIYHYSVSGIRQFMAQKKRDVLRTYLPSISTREYKYVNLQSKRDFLRCLGWALYANLFVFELARGMFWSIRHRDAVCLALPILAIIPADYVAWLMLRSRDGRKFLQSWLTKRK